MNCIYVLLFYQSDIKKEKYINFLYTLKKKKYYFVFVSHKTIINNTV